MSFDIQLSSKDNIAHLMINELRKQWIKIAGSRPTAGYCGSLHSCFRPTDQPKNTSGHFNAFEPLINCQIVKSLITVHQRKEFTDKTENSFVDQQILISFKQILHTFFRATSWLSFVWIFAQISVSWSSIYQELVI